MQLLINIDVGDLEKGISFYEKGLGLQLARRLFDGVVAEMAGGQSVIYLIENPAGSDAVPGTSIRRDYNRHWTPVHLDFVVEEIHAAVERAVSAGAKQDGEMQSFAWGRLATMSDPFGHGFCLLQFVGKGYEQGEVGGLADLSGMNNDGFALLIQNALAKRARILAWPTHQPV